MGPLKKQNISREYIAIDSGPCMVVRLKHVDEVTRMRHGSKYTLHDDKHCHHLGLAPAGPQD